MWTHTFVLGLVGVAMVGRYHVLAAQQNPGRSRLDEDT